MHARATIHMRACGPVAYFNAFLHTEEGLYTRNVCVFFKTIFDTFEYLLLYQSYPITFSSVTHFVGTFLLPFIYFFRRRREIFHIATTSDYKKFVIIFPCLVNL